jgi:hypothetical protein
MNQKWAIPDEATVRLHIKGCLSIRIEGEAERLLTLVNVHHRDLSNEAECGMLRLAFRLFEMAEDVCEMEERLRPRTWRERRARRGPRRMWRGLCAAARRALGAPEKFDLGGHTEL